MDPSIRHLSSSLTEFGRLAGSSLGTPLATTGEVQRIHLWLLAVTSVIAGCSGEPLLDATSSASTTTSSTGAGSGGASAGVTSTTVSSSSTGAGGTGGEGGVAVYGFPNAWPNGTGCGAEDGLFVHRYADDTFILRQSLCTSFEGPFIYLFFGRDRALLQDTGDGGIPVAATVQGLIDDWLAEHAQVSIELIVTHSHAHGDHTGGDGVLAGLANTQVVGTSVGAVSSFFGIADWPNQVVAYDLGDRVIDVIPIPGHQAAHVALYDRRHQLLLTGDTLYPGRLYINDFADYRASVARLIDFVEAGHAATWVLGTHIEMTQTAQQDFPYGQTQHANEHTLQLQTAQLTELDAALQAMGGSPNYERHADFIIVP